MNQDHCINEETFIRWVDSNQREHPSCGGKLSTWTANARDEGRAMPIIKDRRPYFKMDGAKVDFIERRLNPITPRSMLVEDVYRVGVQMYQLNPVLDDVAARRWAEKWQVQLLPSPPFGSTRAPSDPNNRWVMVPPFYLLERYESFP